MSEGEVMGSLNASLAKKLAEKYDPTLEENIRTWLSTTLSQPEITRPECNLQEYLKNGEK